MWQNSFSTESRFVYYGKKTRDGFRVTRFGKNFPFLHDEYIGSLLILVKHSGHEYKGYVLSLDAEIEAFFDYFSLSYSEENSCVIRKDATAEEYGGLPYECLTKHVRAIDEWPATSSMAQIARECYNCSKSVTMQMIRKGPSTAILGWLDAEYKLFRALRKVI